LSAGKDYPARKFATAMNFWPLGEKGAAYDILSEKEK
jgi:hypothetical protein